MCSLLQMERAFGNQSDVSRHVHRLSALRTVLGETHHQPTWAFRTPMIVKVIGTALIPIIVAMLEALAAIVYLFPR